MEVRGEPDRVGLFFYNVDPGDEIQATRPSGRLCLLSQLSALDLLGATFMFPFLVHCGHCFTSMVKMEDDKPNFSLVFTQNIICCHLL